MQLYWNHNIGFYFKLNIHQRKTKKRRVTCEQHIFCKEVGKKSMKLGSFYMIKDRLLCRITRGAELKLVRFNG